MKQFIAFFRKECMEQIRSGKLLILLIVFIIFGIMNPAMAKLTPWIMEMAAESLTEIGLAITDVEVNALTSWEQYYKNVPMALLVFLLMYSGIFTTEYQKGTLINILTKGMSRTRVVLAKALLLMLVWTVGYLLCFLITYGYNAYFWDNGIAQHAFFAAACIYAAGVWLISLLVLASVLVSASSTAALLVAGAFGVVYFLSMIPAIKDYLPTKLLGGGGMLSGSGVPGDYYPALAVSLVLVAVNILAAVMFFRRKNIV